MILTIPLTIVFFMLQGLISVLPFSSGLPDVLRDSFSFVFGYLYAFDFLLSVDVIIALLTLSLSFELAIQVWHGIHWLLRKIPFLHIN